MMMNIMVRLTKLKLVDTMTTNIMIKVYVFKRKIIVVLHGTIFMMVIN